MKTEAWCAAVHDQRVGRDLETEQQQHCFWNKIQILQHGMRVLFMVQLLQTFPPRLINTIPPFTLGSLMF